MPHCWHIYALTVRYITTLSPLCLHGAVGLGRAVRMLLYEDVKTSFLAARVLWHGVFLLPEYHHLLSNATIVYLGC